ncbi:MAG: hypothetical protein P4L69_15115 [Desulfosporosinus sp.]|nr:hypothetical protein [Desulfosporosinus sp.]
MAEVSDNAKFREKHNCKRKKYKCNECQDQQAYCSKCYFQHLNDKHNRDLPLSVSDEVEKRISRIEKCLDGDNKEKMQLRGLDKRAGEMRQELDGPLKEAREITEKKMRDIKRMLWETETYDAEARKCAGQLDMKVRASWLCYDREMERVKAELQAIRSMNDIFEADKASIRVENEVKSALWLNCDAIRGAIRKCEEAAGKLKCAYREINVKVTMCQKDAIMIANIVQTVSKVINEQLKECKDKIERHLKESEEAVVKSVNNMIKRCRDERAKFERVRIPGGIIIQPEESNTASVIDLKENQLEEKKDELEQREEEKSGLDAEKRLASKVDDLKRAQQDNEWRKDNAIEARDLLSEEIAEDEKYEEAPKAGSSIYTHYYPHIGAKAVYLYNTVTKKVSTLTIGCDHLDNYSSTIFVGDNLYIIGGEGPSSAVYSLEIVDGIAECEAIKKKELRVARSRLGLSQYAGNYIYALGGWNSKTLVKCCEKYDIENDNWNALKDLSEGKCLLSACVTNEFIYAIGGCTTEGHLDSIERMNIFKEYESWEKLVIDNEDEGWIARCSCGACKINEDTIMIFGGSYDSKCRAECYLMKSVNNAAVIRKLPDNLAKADDFCLIANSVIRNGQLYSLSWGKNLHVCDLKSKTWKIQEGVFD